MSWYVRLHKSVPCYTFGNRYGIHTDLLQVLVCLGFWPRFCHVLLLNDKTWNSPLLWLLSRHLSLVQQYLGRVNREVTFRSPCMFSPGLSALRWAGALSRIRNVCLSWLSRRPTSIKTHWNFPCSSRQFQLCGLHQKNRDISTKLTGNLTIRSFSNYSPSTTGGRG